MGLSFSLPYENVNDLDDRIESVISKSLNIKENDVRTVLRSFSFDDCHLSKLAKMRSFSSNRMILRGSLSFNERVESKARVPQPPVKTPISPLPEPNIKRVESIVSELKTQGPESPSAKPVMNRDLAAVKLQKTYKSFRTRRQLADCAVMVEQSWWKLLDFAQLKCSSVSFFEVEKPETAVSRWSRARTRAAKVGKGLSKNEKARKLALQHWLEAIDPRHRYGHNLQFYYAKWLVCESRQPFFYWLDIGEGKEVNLERCPRPKLLQQCIKYLGPTEREEYEVIVEDGKFMYKLSKTIIDTTGGPKDTKWIFVLSTSMVLYIGTKQKGKFQHSSFLAGGATISAGRLVIIDGILKAVWPHSGHYLPTEENFDAFISFLEQHHVDLDAVKKSPDDEDEMSFGVAGFGMRNSVSEPIIFGGTVETNTKIYQRKNSRNDRRTKSLRLSSDLKSKITTLEIPKNDNAISAFQKKAQEPELKFESEPESDSDTSTDYDTAEEFLSDFELMVSKRNLFDYGEEEAYEERVPQEKIMKRINSHKENKSFQLAEQLSFKWTTGVGPRIGCVRDYPVELQNRAMEEMCLSPRSSCVSPRKFGFTNASMYQETSSPSKRKLEKSSLYPGNQS
ncbi:IQ domain-containing protein IQM6-like [Rutidosis leptorrhynchoides]|uniref:IQ domain-containing protein IQM6-like n=1 Tax=Rutidosis leptorrhynchoides TaxID=125765 RepID=UPI003A9984BD